MINDPIRIVHIDRFAPGLLNLSDDGGTDEFPEFIPRRRFSSAPPRGNQRRKLVIRRPNPFSRNKIP